MKTSISWSGDLSRWVGLMWLLVVLGGCSGSHQVVFESTNGGRQLVYDCNNFQPQMENGHDVAIVARAAGETMQAMIADQSSISAQELQHAVQDATSNQDWRTVERLVVMYRCNHKR